MWRKDMSTMDAINSNEDKYMIKVSEDDAINAKFNTKLQELLDIAHSKKNVIEDTELIKHSTTAHAGRGSVHGTASSVSRINSFRISTPHLTSGTRSITVKEFSPLTSFQT